MATTTTLHARIDSDLKENVDTILARLGLTSTDAIKLFYKQIELNGGLPFEVKIPSSVLAETALLKELEIGARSAEDNGWLSVEESKRRLRL